jgi:hypothetical protein
MSGQKIESIESAWNLTKKYWFHFFSLISIVVFMLMGFSPGMSVFWATVASLVTSFLRSDSAMISYDTFQGKAPFWASLYHSKFTQALSGGFTQVLSIAATCAGAGLIVGVVVLTGLGLKFSAIVLDYADGSLFLTALFTGLVVWIVGLAVPVVPSFYRVGYGGNTAVFGMVIDTWWKYAIAMNYQMTRATIDALLRNFYWNWMSNTVLGTDTVGRPIKCSVTDVTLLKYSWCQFSASIFGYWSGVTDVFFALAQVDYLLVQIAVSSAINWACSDFFVTRHIRSACSPPVPPLVRL